MTETVVTNGSALPVKYSSMEHVSVSYESEEEIAKQYKKYINAPKYDLNSEEVYCICRKPDHGGELMIGCDGCDEWYHFRCMRINPIYRNLVAKFYCKFCQWKGEGTTKWKRKCRLDTCWNPIENNSKYCSKECGLQYFRSLTLQRDNSDLLPSRIKHIMEGFDFDRFKQLGNQFPELPYINSVDENIDRLPEEMRVNLTNLNHDYTNVSNQIAELEQKLTLLAQYKDDMKLLNDKVTESSSKKKLELCLYNKHLNDITPDMVHTLDIDNIVQIYNDPDHSTWHNHLCIQEKRKCLRHNGWFNLINDNLVKKMNQLHNDLTRLNNDKLLLLRDYTISVYEQ